MNIFRGIALLVAARLLSFGQPIIDPGGIRNAALVSVTNPQQGLAPRSLISIFGRNLASSVASSGVPFPTTLGGVQVLIAGLPAPISYVSPNQINAQIPRNVLGSPRIPTTVQVVVSNETSRSEPYALPITPLSPGIFVQNGSGCGPAVVMQQKRFGELEPNTATNSASPGQYITLYTTGLGSSEFIQDGNPDTSPVRDQSPFSAIINFSDQAVVPSQRLISHVFPGVEEITVRIPTDAPEGCSVPVSLGANFQSQTTQNVTMSIRKGGGICLDVADSAAHITALKTTYSGNSPAPPTDQLLVDFSSSVGKKRAPLNLPGELNQCRCSYLFLPAAPLPSCPIEAGYLSRRLDPGDLEYALPTNWSPAIPQDRSSSGPYSVSLAPGSLKGFIGVRNRLNPGDVGSFGTGIILPEPVKITTTFPPNGIVNRNVIQFDWTGGDPHGFLQFNLKSLALSGTTENICTCWAAISDRTFKYISSPSNILNLRDTDQGQIEITQAPITPSLFMADGLSLGGVMDYSYRYLFTDLKFRGN